MEYPLVFGKCLSNWPQFSLSVFVTIPPSLSLAFPHSFRLFCVYCLPHYVSWRFLGILQLISLTLEGSGIKRPSVWLTEEKAGGSQSCRHPSGTFSRAGKATRGRLGWKKREIINGCKFYWKHRWFWLVIWFILPWLSHHWVRWQRHSMWVRLLSPQMFSIPSG